ncbi:MAG TPA: hypothetical protein VFI27_01030 [candidate division Zixibacteria bacterium]|nr:hypothetical protein [candidate division Zixibacteria bacterium]
MTKKHRQELDRMHWKDRYEYEARQAAESMLGFSEAELIERIRGNRLDPYFAIWRAIGRIGTVQGSALVLWAFLQSNPGEQKMLHRYHCADALFKILELPDPASKNELRERVQWAHQGEEKRLEALLELKGLIEVMIQNELLP